MAHCRAEIEVLRPIDEVFAYVADFSNAAQWDPGVVSARRLEEGPVRVGSEFEIVSRFLGRNVTLRYRATQVDPPSRVVFEGEGSTVRLVDAITLSTAGEGTRIAYDANLAPQGLWILADLPFHLLFQRMGRRAMTGLERALRETGGPR